jgi:hypothetical protein
LDPGVYGTDRQAVVKAVAEARIVAHIAGRCDQKHVVGSCKLIESLADGVIGV